MERGGRWKEWYRGGSSGKEVSKYGLSEHYRPGEASIYIAFIYHGSVLSGHHPLLRGPPFLYVIFDKRNRSHVVMPAPKRVIRHEEDEDARPDDAAPVHLARRRARSRGEELEQPEHGEESQRDDVDRVAGSAEVEAGKRERVAAEALAEDTWGWDL